MPLERRRARRVSFEAPVLLRLGGRRVRGQARNLSSSGMLMSTASPVTIGEIGQLELVVNGQPLVLEAMVVRRFNPSAACALQFRGVQDAVRHHLEALTRAPPVVSREPRPPRHWKLDGPSLLSLYQQALEEIDRESGEGLGRRGRRGWPGPRH